MTAQALLQEAEAALDELGLRAEPDRARLLPLAEQVHAAHVRLRDRAARCQALWRAGRIDEARQEARRGGALRDELAWTGFQRSGEWRALCARLGLPIHPAVDAASVEELVRCLEAPPTRREALLRAARRAALGRAPLVDRLGLVRVLVDEAPDEPGWREDLRQLEQARQGEIARQSREAGERRDRAALLRLRGELATSPWVAPPPPATLAAVEDALRPLEAERSGERLGALGGELGAAWEARDETRCRALLADWELVRRHAAAPAAAATLDVAPIEAWLAELDAERAGERAFGAVCAAVEQALDEGHDLEDLERAIGAALRLERELPQALRARCASRLEELRTARRRTFALRLVLALGCLAIVAGVVAVALEARARASEERRWVEALRGTLDAGELAQAEALAARLERDAPELARAPALAGLLHEVAGRARAAEEGARRFEAALGALEAEGVEGARFERLLEGAADLAATPEQRARLEEWRLRRARHVAALRAEREAILEPRLEALERRTDALRASNARGRTGASGELDELLAEARALAASAGTGEAFRARAQQLVSALTVLHARAEARQQEAEAAARDLAELRRTLAPEALARSLERFARDHPTHLLAGDLARAAGQVEAWQAVDAWRALTIGWGDSLHVASREQALARAERVQGHLARFPASPLRDEARRAAGYLAKATSALGGPHARGLTLIEGLLASPLISEAYSVSGRAGGRFYLLDPAVQEQPRRGEVEVWTFDYVVNTALETRKRIWTSARDGSRPRPVPAPQQALARAVEALLEGRGREAWETCFLELARRALEVEGLDPILAASVVRVVLTLAADLAPTQGEQLLALARPLEALELTDLPWMDPTSREAAAARPRAARALERLGALPDVLAAIERDLRPPTRLRPVGVYLEGLEAEEGAPDGELVVLAGEELVQVGRIAGGRAELAPWAGARVGPGTLVFVALD